MGRTPVELHVGGQTYRVVASADESELKELADVVDARLRELSAGRPVAAQNLLLAAISLAHDLERERRERRELEKRSREALSSVLQRIDAALEASAELESTESETDASSTNGSDGDSRHPDG